MDHDGGVLPSFDDFVEIADRPITDRQRQRAIVPDGPFRREQETAGKVGSGHVLMGRDGDQRAFEPPGHVFDEAGLATAGRALEHDRQAARIGGFEQGDLARDRQVIRLGPNTINVELHGRSCVRRQDRPEYATTPARSWLSSVSANIKHDAFVAPVRGVSTPRAALHHQPNRSTNASWLDFTA